MKKLLLSALASGKELNVIQNQYIDLTKLLFELSHPFAPNRADQLFMKDSAGMNSTLRALGLELQIR